MQSICIMNYILLRWYVLYKKVKQTPKCFQYLFWDGEIIDVFRCLLIFKKSRFFYITSKKIYYKVKFNIIKKTMLK